MVHHVDGNHADDHPDNLRVLPGHWYERREAKGVQHLWPLDEWLELRGAVSVQVATRNLATVS